MTSDDRLAELLEKWEERTVAGEGETVGQFCERHQAAELHEPLRRLLDRLGLLQQVMGESTVPQEFRDATLEHTETGRYQPISFHAKGGLGVVYVAEDQELHRNVALKCMQNLAAADSGSRQRFLLEAVITGKLEHPGVVPVYGMGTNPQGQPFYAMRFIEGRNLNEEIDAFQAGAGKEPGARNVEMRRLLRHFVAVCETMAYAHSRGIIHRDLKPANIMIGPYGETLVVDWGLAKQIGQAAVADTEPSGSILSTHMPGSGAEHTIQGRAKGSPVFMSPEQARGAWNEVGPASDIYSLGSTLFVLLTGQRPYGGKSVREVIERVVKGDFPRPCAANPSVPRALEAVCLKAMASDPTQRYAGAKDLAADVERWLADEPVTAWREPWAMRARRWLRRRRTLVTVTAACVLIGLAAAVLLNVQQQQSNQRLQQSNQDLREANLREQAATSDAVTQRNKSEANRQLALKTLYPATMNTVAASIDEEKYDRAAALLREVMPPPGEFIDHRQFEWYYAWHLLEETRGEALQFPPFPNHLQLSDDGSLCAAVCMREGKLVGDRIQIRRVATGEVVLALETSRSALTALSGDGRWFAVTNRKEIEIWRLPANGKAQRERSIAAFDGDVQQLLISKDGESVFASGDIGRLRAWKTADGEPLFAADVFPASRALKDRITSLSLSPDGRWLAFRQGLKPFIFELAGGKLRPVAIPDLWKKDYGGCHSLGFSESSMLMAWIYDNAADFALFLSLPADGTAEVKVEQRIKLPIVLTRPLPFMGFNRGDGGQAFCTFNPGPVSGRGLRMWWLARPALAGKSADDLALRPLFPDSFEALPMLPIYGRCLALTSDGKTSAVGDDLGRVTFLQMDKVFDRRIEPRHLIEVRNNHVRRMAFSPTSELFTLSEAGRVTMAPMRATTGRVCEPPGIGRRNTVRAADLSADGAWLAFGRAGELHLYDRANDRFAAELPITPWREIASAPLLLQFIPGSTRLAVAMGDPDRRVGKETPEPSVIGLWDFAATVKAGAARAAVAGPPIDVLARSPEKLLATKWEATGPVSVLATSPDGRWLAASSGVEAYLWQTDRFGKEPPLTRKASTEIMALMVDPSGDRLIAGCQDGAVWLWPLEGNAPPERIQALGKAVQALALAPDGKTIITAGEDGRIVFVTRDLPYQRFTINVRSPFPPHGITSLALTPDRRTLAAGFASGNILYFEADSADTILATTRRRYAQAGDEQRRERLRDYLLALWSSYLERRQKNDAPGAKAAVDEALGLEDKLPGAARGEFAEWLAAFRREWEQAMK